MSHDRSKTPAAVPDRLFIGAPEAARLLGLDQRTIRRALEKGEVPGFRVGVAWRIPTAWVRAQAGIGTHDAAPA